jgi:hypothetical protein
MEGVPFQDKENGHIQEWEGAKPLTNHVYL